MRLPAEPTQSVGSIGVSGRTHSRPLLLAHLSDIHLDGTAPVLHRVMAVIDYLGKAKTRLDVIVLSGDLAADSSGASDHRQTVVAELAAFAPVAWCAGNIDPDRATPAIPGASRTVVVDRLHVIPIDSAATTPPALDPGSVDAVKALLRTLPDGDRALLVIHHPPAPLHDTIGDQLLLSDNGPLGALVKHPAVIGTLAGHTHTATSANFQGKPLLIAPGIRSEGCLPFLEVTEYGDPLIDNDTNPAFFLHAIRGREITTYMRQVRVR